MKHFWRALFVLGMGLLPIHSTSPTQIIQANDIYLPLVFRQEEAGKYKIVFSTDRDGNFEIYSVRLDGMELTRLTNNPHQDNNPVWSPDRTRIAYDTYGEGGSCDIYVMNADGSDQTRLTIAPGCDSDPAWSPDGTKIVFTYSNATGIQPGDIYVINSNGSGRTQLTDNAEWDFEPNWSPDGQKIAFISKRDGSNDVFTMDADGSNQVNLTNSPGAEEQDPDWSPDGRKIAFSDIISWNGIVIMNADGANPELVPNTGFVFPPLGAYTNNTSAWAPDSTKIVFNKYVLDHYRQQIFVINVDGTGLTPLTMLYAHNLNPDW